MSTNYDHDIKVAEAEYQLDAQKSAIKRVELEMLKMERKKEEYLQTIQDLEGEIVKSKQRVKDLKEGVVQEGGGE